MPRTSRLSRRGFLVGTGLAVLGAGGGVAAGLLVDRSAKEGPPPNPAVLLAAAQAERELIRRVASARGTARPLLEQIRADHEAHLSALLALVAEATGATPTAGPTGALSGPTSRDKLRALESAAATSAAKRALSLTGRDAAVLASISACETTHAELLK